MSNCIVFEDFKTTVPNLFAERSIERLKEIDEKLL